MKNYVRRLKQINPVDNVLRIIHDFAYFETFILLGLYFWMGYLIDPDDICIINGEVSYILILLAVITLFHGFENGMLGISIVAFMMWYFYDTFAYNEFLVTLLMTMIFSEFHFYWNKKIKVAEVNANYKGAKLDELSRAFYSLKISHDQLEKNYVVKPMSIRNSIEYILQKNKEIDENEKDRSRYYYLNFLELLGKSFNVSSSMAIYKKPNAKKKLISYKTANIVFEANTEEMDIKEVFEDYLVDRAIERGIPIFISDEKGEPSPTMKSEDSKFIATFPIVQEGDVVAVIIIRKMPFMSFNREVLTSIAILSDYFAMEERNAVMLYEKDPLEIVSDRDFRFEYLRLLKIYELYKVDSFILVLRIKYELQATRVYEGIVKMLRSLDKATLLNNDGLYYILIMFPLNDKAAALGFYNRLINTLDEEKDKEFNYMTFSMTQTELLNKYVREDYAS